MSGSNEEIPNFYRDPITGKYYRDQLGGSRNPALKNLKSKRAFCSEVKTTNVANVAQYLSTREKRGIGGVLESKEYLNMNCFLKRERYSVELDEMINDDNLLPFPSIDYVVGSEHSLYCSWYRGDSEIQRCRYIVGTTKFADFFSEEGFFEDILISVVDICESLLDTDILVLCNWTFLNDGSIMQKVGPSGRRFMLEDFQKEMFCLSPNKTGLFYAIGCNNAIGFMDAHDGKTSTMNINGRVHTITFDVTGNLMASGVHTGKLFFHDLRSKEMVMDYEVSKSCLLHSSMLNSDHLIVSGVDDVLCKVDIRKKAVVSQFLSHKQKSARRQPFSIASNLLCAVGSDNKIRIWTLSGGFPVHEIKPFEHAKNKIRGWLHTMDNKTSLYYFENACKKVFDVMNI